MIQDRWSRGVDLEVHVMSLKNNSTKFTQSSLQSNNQTSNLNLNQLMNKIRVGTALDKEGWELPVSDWKVFIIWLVLSYMSGSPP